MIHVGRCTDFHAVCVCYINTETLFVNAYILSCNTPLLIQKAPPNE